MAEQGITGASHWLGRQPWLRVMICSVNWDERWDQSETFGRQTLLAFQWAALTPLEDLRSHRGTYDFKHAHVLEKDILKEQGILGSIVQVERFRTGHFCIFCKRDMHTQDARLCKFRETLFQTLHM